MTSASKIVLDDGKVSLAVVFNGGYASHLSFATEHLTGILAH